MIECAHCGHAQVVGYGADHFVCNECAYHNTIVVDRDEHYTVASLKTYMIPEGYREWYMRGVDRAREHFLARWVYMPFWFRIMAAMYPEALELKMYGQDKD